MSTAPRFKLAARYRDKTATERRPAITYRGGLQIRRGRRNASWRPCDKLKAARLRRGITRRYLDAERHAVRQFILTETVARGFTEGQLLALAGQMVMHAPR